MTVQVRNSIAECFSLNVEVLIFNDEALIFNVAVLIFIVECSSLNIEDQRLIVETLCPTLIDRGGDADPCALAFAALDFEPALQPLGALAHTDQAEVPVAGQPIIIRVEAAPVVSNA